MSAEIIDFDEAKRRRLAEQRRKTIQNLTGMVGEPLHLEDLKPDPNEIVFGPDEIGY